MLHNEWHDAKLGKGGKSKKEAETFGGVQLELEVQILGEDGKPQPKVLLGGAGQPEEEGEEEEDGAFQPDANVLEICVSTNLELCLFTHSTWSTIRGSLRRCGR